MKKATFKDWDLDQLDNAFGLTQIWQCELLKKWENYSCEITAFEKENLLNFQEVLIRGGRAWNEVELENKFIAFSIRDNIII